MSASDADRSAIPKLTMRPDTSALTPAQIRTLRHAFAAAAADGTYAKIAGLSGLPGQYSQHHTALFLPWHRAYLARFEANLRKAAADVAVPAWDWWNEPRVPAAFAEPTADGLPNPLYRAEIPPDVIKAAQAHGNLPDPGLTSTIRAPGASIRNFPNRNELAHALSATNFNDFAARIESIHDQLHVWLGGTSAEITRGAYDPVNWPVAASIDQVWRAWQLRHPGANPPENILAETLEPFGVTVADVLDPIKLGYDYQVTDLSRIGHQVVLPGYFSDSVPAKPVDLLQLDADINSLAWVIAARKTAPPLAVGLFGDWGSGKSTFMALLRERISELTGQGQPEMSAWCTSVRQITFDAWQYAEDDLWASLVSHILGELSVSELYDQPGDGLLGHLAGTTGAGLRFVRPAARRSAA